MPPQKIKKLPQNIVAVHSSAFERFEEDPTKIDSLITNPKDIYYFLNKVKSLSGVTFTKKKDYECNYDLQVFIDDIGYKSFDDLPRDKLLSSEDPLLLQIFPQMAKLLKDFKQRIEHTLKNSYQNNINEKNDKKYLKRSRENSIYPELRTFGLLIPFHLNDCWSLLWIKFSEYKKYVEIFQVDSKPRFISEINYNLKYLTKVIACYLLDLDLDQLVYSFKHSMPRIEDEEHDNEKLLIINMLGIIQGYQENGFNINLSTLANINSDIIIEKPRGRRCTLENFEDEIFTDGSDVSLDDIRALKKRKFNSILSNEDDDGEKCELEIQSISENGKHRNSNNNGKSSRSRMKSKYTGRTNIILGSNPSSDIRESSAESDSELISDSDVESSSGLSKKSKYKSASEEVGEIQEKKEEDTHSDDSSKHNLEVALGEKTLEIIVTHANLSRVKRSLNYDSKKLEQIMSQYKSTYESIQSYFYSKWARMPAPRRLKIPPEGPEFQMYGPTQIELEIMTAGGLITLQTLRKEVDRLNISPTPPQLRFMAGARRWINQRFGYNKQKKHVIYFKEENMVVPDYMDALYIVVATHVEHGCLEPSATFEIVRRNWYISRKCVAFIISRCYKCKGKKMRTI